MYNDVGKELKRWAKFVVIIQTAPFVLCGIAVFVYMSELEGPLIGLILAAVIIAIGYFFARLSQIKEYAFGELVDRVCSIEVKMHGGRMHQKKVDVEVKKDQHSGEPVVMRDSGGSWQCAYCDHKNPAGSDWCEKCGVQAFMDGK